MLEVVIADDDAVVRSSLLSLIDWEEKGLHLQGLAADGQRALELVREQQVDILITDIKMPRMDGIELIRQLSQEKSLPHTLVLSAYNEYELVRCAFKMGIVDYILKVDITKCSLNQRLDELMEQCFSNIPPAQPQQASRQDWFHLALREGALPEGAPLQFPCRPVVFEIQKIEEVLARFQGHLEQELWEPMINFARQIKLVEHRCWFQADSGVLLMVCEGLSLTDTEGLCKQLAAVWNSYMNLRVQAGVGSEITHQEDFLGNLNEAKQNLQLSCIFGPMPLYSPSLYTVFHPKSPKLVQFAAEYKLLVRSFLLADLAAFEREKERLAQAIRAAQPRQARELCRCLVFVLAQALAERADRYLLIHRGVAVEQALAVLEEPHDLSLWCLNFLRETFGYAEQRYENRLTSKIQQARRYIKDNYYDPQLSLVGVADVVELSEKYFSNRFKEETGTSFTEYLTDVRLERAKELLMGSGLKMFEIATEVGYGSVEHFTRTFKRHTGESPQQYRQRHRTKSQ